MNRNTRGFAIGALLIWLICPAAIFGAPVSEEQASNAVLHAVAIYRPATGASLQRFSTPFGYSERAVRHVDNLMRGASKVGYVVSLAPSGYYLMSSDDQLPLWKLHSDEGDFTNLPPGLIKVLELQMAEDQQALENLKKFNKSTNPKFHAHWQALLDASGATNSATEETTGAAGSYLLSTTWDQGVPYNYYCPVASGGPGGRAWAGCTACALAQILRYSSQPAVVAQNLTYTDNSGACQATHSISDAGMGPYYWADMPSSVNTSSPLVQQEAIAQLMYHAAVALRSDFEYNGTSAYPSDIPYVLQTYFNYTSGGLESRSGYSDSQWYNKIAADIDANKPVFYAMWTADGSEGHAIVCDGYQNGDEIHLNLGWSGAYNAWYNLDSIVTGGLTWTTQDAVFGITPPGKSLVSLVINGPTTINENSTAQYTAKANYSDGTSQNVSPNWSVLSGPGSISTSGLLTVGEVGSNATVFVYALYQNAGSEMDVTVLHVTNQYILNATASGGGSISPSGNLVPQDGSSQSFAATPNTRYTVNHWILDGIVVQIGGTNYTLSNIQTNHILQVTFAPTLPTLSHMCFSNGIPSFQMTSAGVISVIQASSNLVDWKNISTNSIPAGDTLLIRDPGASNQPVRFYRAVPFGPTVVFSDNFSANAIDSTKWTTTGNTVLQTNQTMEVLTTQTDAGGNLTSVSFPVHSTGIITVTRQVLLHYGNNDFEGQFGMTIGSLPMLSVRYANMAYGDGVTFQPCHGFFLARNNGRPDVIADNADVSAAITPLWDTWFNEKVTYDPKTGMMQYFINDVGEGTFNVGALPQTNSPTMSLFFSAWGWNTGHQQLFQNLVVSQTH